MVLFCSALLISDAAEAFFHAGTAKVDITPNYPIRLSGYGNRRTESEGVAQRIWAKALAIGSDADGAAVLVTVENCGVSDRLTEEVAVRLARKAGIARERFTVCSTHSHTAPCLTGVAPNLFSQEIPKEHQLAIDRYTQELTDGIERAALAALADRTPSRLAWGQGQAAFAQNRRTKGGPVDHALPVLRVTDAKGTVRAVLANYACHCTTLEGGFNQIHGDWAGFAQEYIERDHPGAIALITIGCGADANPQPRGKLEHAAQHGEEIAREVKRLVSSPLTPLQARLNCRSKKFDLSFQNLPSRQQWEERAQKSGIVGYHAQVNLARLDRGETLPATLPYVVQTWNFGDQLAMVFLAGEVVVDYSIRLKTEFDASRLWVTAYANYVPCYIPSQRILREGGYEAETSLWYYDRPARLVPQTEEWIHKAAHELLPKEFLFDAKKAEFPPPKSPEDSLGCIQTKAGFKVELVAAEPLVVDPVAIDFGPDGKLWVVEMRDFPMGLDGKWKPGGRVKFLEDLDGDGKYDKATVLLDGVPFPTGVMAWRKGALICAAPDILYAEDRNGDGRADAVQKWLTGFATENYQARVNGLSLGLDNWIYGANGLIGGVIKKGGASWHDGTEYFAGTVNIRGRDFRINPATGEFEAAAGLSQQGRVRDDWSNWFGCDNSTLLWHFPLPEHYVRRNTNVASPNLRVSVVSGPDPNQLFPISRTLRRFNDPHHANRVTSVCGLGIYRDDLLGDEYYGNAFVCEPVHNLVHRLALSEHGATFNAQRAPGEERSEFLASTDNWFRPVQARTGPDGALWIVDMYRFVVEHPRWITPDRLKELDLRAGEDRGRIYRVYPQGKTLAPIRQLTGLSVPELARALDHPNGTERDRVHQELLRRKDASAARVLDDLVRVNSRPAVRVQALAVLHGLKACSDALILSALADRHPEVRAHAMRIAEERLPSPSIQEALLKLAGDTSYRVQYQLALSLGQMTDERVAGVLSRALNQGSGDPWLQAAVLSSSGRYAESSLAALLSSSAVKEFPPDFLGDLAATALAQARREKLVDAILRLAPRLESVSEPWQLTVAAKLCDALDRQQLKLASLRSSSGSNARRAADQIEAITARARELGGNGSADETLRERACRLLGRDSAHDATDTALLIGLLRAQTSPRLNKAALGALERSQSPKLARLLLAEWPSYSPSLRVAVLETLLRREEWTAALLWEMRTGTLMLGELSAGQQQRLLKHPRAAIRRSAIRAFANASSRKRPAILGQFQPALQLVGDRAKGQTLFRSICANCHRFYGEGTAVGSNLEALTDKSARFLLTAILDPNAAVEDRFTDYSVELRDGRSLSGIIADEGPASLTLLNAGGVRETILRTEIREIRASKLSLMPEGLESNLKPQDLADVIAFIQRGPVVNGAEARPAAGALSAPRPAPE